MSRKFTPKTCTRQHITKNKLNNLRNTQTVDARKGHEIFDEPVGVNVYPHTLKRAPTLQFTHLLLNQTSGGDVT
jgi:hypothetical protein